MIDLKYTKIDPSVPDLVVSEGNAGIDLATIDEIKLSSYPTFFHGQSSWSIRTGICLEIPEGFYGLIVPRSSTYERYGLTQANSAGIIDSSYRGEIRLLFVSNNLLDLVIPKGTRLAQLIIMEYPKVSLVEVSALSTTSRGSGGFGSTGA